MAHSAPEQKIIWPHYRETLAEHSAIWSDQYALTMSQALFAKDKHDVNTTFHAYIRKTPFKGSYLLTAGQNIIFEWMKNNWKFDAIDIEILRNEKTKDLKTGEMVRLYSDEFIDMLADSKFELTVDAMPEGEIAFPDEPIMRINGPAWQCLMVEAAILNAINSQSLFGTLASRLVIAAENDPILELGLRRAQAIGGLEPTRGAYIGGISGTSNMLAKKYYGIPSIGTMAHAYVMLHENELEGFANYAETMPNNSVFLVDTYNTLEGIYNATQTCQKLGIQLKGIRLDSGDLLKFSIEGRKILDKFGFDQATIAASNDLDEATIIDLKKRGAKIDVWGIGTNLVTAKDQPALGAVYKLGAVFDYHKTITQEELDALKEGCKKGLRKAEDLNDYLRETIKLSSDPAKTSIPGELEVIRHLKQIEGKFYFKHDTIVNYTNDNRVKEDRLTGKMTNIDKKFRLRHDFLENTAAYYPLQRYMEKGIMIGQIETIHDARERAKEKLAMLEDNYTRLVEPDIYPVGLEESLFDEREAKIFNSFPAVA